MPRVGLVEYCPNCNISITLIIKHGRRGSYYGCPRANCTVSWGLVTQMVQSTNTTPLADWEKELLEGGDVYIERPCVCGHRGHNIYQGYCTYEDCSCKKYKAQMTSEEKQKKQAESIDTLCVQIVNGRLPADLCQKIESALNERSTRDKMEALHPAHKAALRCRNEVTLVSNQLSRCILKTGHSENHTDGRWRWNELGTVWADI